MNVWPVGRTLAVLALLSLSLGCSGKVPVSGKVTVKGGKPPEGASVVFSDEKAHRSARGVIAADGSFKLGTDGADDGAKPGKYVVTVHPPYPKDSSQPQPKPMFHDKYQRASSSGLEAEVPQKTEFNFELDPPAAAAARTAPVGS
jgi:hypothetical protein